MDFMAEQKKYNEAVKDFNDKLLGDSYSRSFFNDALSNSYETYLKNRDNPAKFEVESSAYIEGVSSEISEEDRDGVLKPILHLNKSLREDSLKNFNDNALEQADSSSIMNRVSAGNLAVRAFKDGLPTDAQMELDANYFNTIEEDVRFGRLTPKQGIELKDLHAENRFTSALQKVLSDKTISADDISELIYRIENGITGNEFVDKLTPTQRMEMLRKAASINKQIDDYEKHLRERQQTTNKNSWEDRQLYLLNYANAGGDPRLIEQMADYQKATAQTQEDYNRVDDVYKTLEGKTNPRIKQDLDNALNDGSLDKQQKLDLVYGSREFLSVKDFQDYIKNINSPVEQELEQQDIQIALKEAKAKYGYNPLGSNNAYDWFVYEINRGLADADTPDKRAKVVENAFSNTDKLYGDRIEPAYRVEATRKFVQKYDSNPETIATDIDNEAVLLAKQGTGRKVVTPKDTIPYQQQAESNVIQQYMRNKNLTYQDATLMIEEAKKIKNMGQ